MGFEKVSQLFFCSNCKIFSLLKTRREPEMNSSSSSSSSNHKGGEYSVY